MICFRDRCFCPFYKECWHGDDCRIALTSKVEKEADIWWGKPGAPIDIFVEKPICFKEKDDEAD